MGQQLLHKKNPLNLQSQSEICEFFQETKLQHFVSYNQYREIFPYDTSFPQKINNHILNGYAHYRNYCISELIPYKYIPISAAALVQIVRLRSPPILLPLLLVYSFDYYFLDYMMWKKRHQKIINIQDGFNYKLVKKQTQIKRNRFLAKYLQYLNQDPNKTVPPKWIDIGMYTPYIFTHGIYDPQESYCYLTKQFQISMALKNFGFQIFKSIYQTIKQDISLFIDYKKEKFHQNNKIYNLLDINIQPNYRIPEKQELQQKIQLYAQIIKYHIDGTTKKIDWKFEDLVTTRTYAEPTNPKSTSNLVVKQELEEIETNQLSTTLQLLFLS